MKVILDSIKAETANISTFYFKTKRPFRYSAGQFIELTLPHSSPDDRGIKRWFTLSSAPGKDLVSITTKQSDKPSSFKAKLWHLQPGDTLDMSEPMGDFVLPKNNQTPLVFVAGGIGITPYHAIVSWLIDQGQTRPIQFLYSVHSQAEVIFADTFDQAYIDTQMFIDKPNLTAEKIIESVGGIDGKQVYISGPEPMTEAIVAQFAKLGVPESQLVTDYFPNYTEV